MEETLDPPNWDEVRELGHNMIDDVIDYLAQIRDSKVWEAMPDETLDYLSQPLPATGQPVDQVYEEFKQHIMPYKMGNTHPRFWGWVIGTGTAFGALGDLLASALNPNNGGGFHSGNYVEMQVINWAQQMLGLEGDYSGLITSGGSMANLIGLTVARNTKADFDLREEGMADHRLRMYGSMEMHSSLIKSAELLGLGRQNLVMIPVNENLQMDTEQLEHKILEDLANGFAPICIIANMGTVNTGAVDNIEKIAQIADNFDLWFHIDAAFGALTKLTPNYHHLAKGLEFADSVAFDFHKWMYVNYEAGCVLVKHRKKHYQAFSFSPDYLTHSTRGIHSGKLWFSDYGIELSRRFKALKIWMSIKEHGIEKYGRVIEKNIEQAKYLDRLVVDNDYLERLAPTSMNIVCFRYNPGGLSDEQLNKINEEILLQLHEQGIAAPSYTTLQGKYAIRMANTNHRSLQSDFDILVNAVLDIGKTISTK